MKRFNKYQLLLPIFLILPVSIIYSQTAPVIHEVNTNPLGIHLSRQVPREYTPGTNMEVVISIYCDAPDPNYPVTAIGLYEMLPPDWVFVSMRGITTEPPPIAPQPGTVGTLQFAWITPPAFPCTFAYTVQVPAGITGVKTISGQVEYRTNGPRLVSAPEITEINGMDREPPVITLLGDNPAIIYQGSGFQEPGYKAQDNADGDITERVQITGNVDTNQVGEYSLTYTVRDNAGNNATATRTIRVLERESQSSTGGTVPVSGGVIMQPSVPTTRSTQPIQTSTNQSQNSSQSSTSTQQGTDKSSKPEEVTFPGERAVIPFQEKANLTPEGKKTDQFPQGMANGKPLKPFEIPKEIKGGVKPPPSFEERKYSQGAPEFPEAVTKIEDTATTSVITTTPQAGTAIKKEEESPTLATTNKENTAPLQTASENTSVVGTTTDAGGGKPSSSFLFQFVNWWSNKSQAERRNLIGMFVLIALLALLCFITGRTAYQGLTPQPRQKTQQIDTTENISEK